ncbi:MAG: M20/M25/M40 family metallo-hydrolase [Deltaproteobacteria bacterium]|nr:MAG: M20/M25/M40 family metallo-hydrolase [Deltaproteobacteria bacterium]
MENSFDTRRLVRDFDFSKVLDFAKALIRTPSLSGQEQQVARLCIEEARRLGFSGNTDPTGNFVARLRVGSGKGPRIVLTGHLDTVNANTAEWTDGAGPFDAVVRDGRLYGRGASDMKAAVACMLHAAALCKGLPSEHFGGEIYMVGTVVEELFEGACFLEALEAIKPDYVVVGEATRCRINIGQRGRAEVVVTVHGIPCHASCGRDTINPIEQAGVVLGLFGEEYEPERDSLLGPRDLVATDIKIPVGGGGGVDGRGGNSTVPNRVEITYDARLLEGDTMESIKALFRDRLDRAHAQGRMKWPDGRPPEVFIADDEHTTYSGVKLKRPKFAPAWKTPADSEIVRKASVGIEKVGLPAELGSYGFCTDASALVEFRKRHPEHDVQVIGFGPSREELAHVVDEYVEIDELRSAFDGYVGLAAELLRSER